MAGGSYSTTVEIRKKIPVISNYYPAIPSEIDNDDIYITNIADGLADVTILLNGCEEVSGQTKKSLIKIEKPETSDGQKDSKSDEPTRIVLDLNRVEDTINIKGFLEDGETYTAWQKLWMLRSMISSGNASGDGARLESLVIDNITFDATSMQAHFEDLTWKFKRDGNEPNTWFTDSSGNNVGDVARIEVGITIYFGEDRFAI